MSNLTAFNTQLDNFVYYLEKIYPENFSIKTYHNSINMVKKVNPRQIVNFFKTYIYIYKDEIMNENASFFLNKNYNDDLNNDPNSMLEVIKFKDLWDTAKEEHKKQIFRYFQLLCLLSEKC